MELSDNCKKTSYIYNDRFVHGYIAPLIRLLWVSVTIRSYSHPLKMTLVVCMREGIYYSYFFFSKATTIINLIKRAGSSCLEYRLLNGCTFFLKIAALASSDTTLETPIYIMA